MRPVGLRFGAVIKKNRKYFVHEFPPFRRLDSGGRLRLFFPGPGGLLGQLGGLLGRFPLDGVAGEQEAVYLEIVGVLLGDDRGDFRKQMLVGFDSPIQIFVQFFPTGKYFPILSGNPGLPVASRRIGINAPAQCPGVRDRFLRRAVIPGILGNGIGHFIDRVASDTEEIPLRLPLVGSVGDGKRPGIFQGFVKKQGSSGLFLPCGGLCL